MIMKRRWSLARNYHTIPVDTVEILLSFVNKTEDKAYVRIFPK